MLWLLLLSECSLELSQKADFMAHSKMLFAYALWHPMSYTLNFCQVKGFMKIILVSFISITFKALRTNSASRKWLFLGSSWVLTPSNTVQFWWNFHQRHFSRNKQFLIFRETGHPKFAFLVQVWPSLPPPLPKSLLPTEDDQNQGK